MAKHKQPDGARTTRGAASLLHPGVSITPYDPKAPSWRVRVSDPNRRGRDLVDRWFHRADGVTWDDDLLPYAIEQARGRAKLKAKRRARHVHAEMHGIELPPDDGAADRRRTLSTMCAEYIVDVTRKPRSESYEDNLHDHLNLWIKWCWARGIRYVDQLVDPNHPPANLTRYRRWVFNERRQKNGERYASSSSDLTIKIVSAALMHECGTYTIRGLDSSMVGLALKLEHAESTNQCEPIKSPALIRDLIMAARAYDRREHRGKYRRQPELAPRATRDVINLLCGGYRLDEYTSLRKRAAVTDVAAAELAVVTVIGKGRRDREASRTRAVFYRDYSPLGAEVLLESLRGQPDNAWVSEHTYGAINNMLRALHTRYGAPLVSAHDLRATCATYMVAVAGLTSEVRAQRLGHSEEEHARTYIKQIVGLKMNAPSLEVAMEIDDLLRAELAEMRAAPRRPKRTASRARKRVFASRALDAKNPDRALADLFSAPPKPRARPTRPTRPRKAVAA